MFTPRAFCLLPILLLLSLLPQCGLNAQTAPGKYWVQFTDKDNSPYSLANPREFLSEKCVERRYRLNLGFDERDLPVKQSYIDEVLALGNCTLHNKSKWFNAITVNVTDTALVNEIAMLPFVLQVKSAESVSGTNNDVMDEKFYAQALSNHRSLHKRTEDCPENAGPYGPSFRQIEMLNGHLLHEMGFTGKGIDIALLDAGWNKTDILPAFELLRSEGRLKLTRDFVYPYAENVFALSNHGTYVLSLMSGIIADSLMGTAPHANYFLFRSEDPGSEYIVEEDNWVAAAELCDSLGIDIINSSLGYSLFDDAMMNHSYADMDGNTTRCSIAADIASEKGILVVNSAGNSGNSPWRYITAPSDGNYVLCVGALNAAGEHASFSSYGPSSDGDVKPNVSAMGQQCVFAALDSTIAVGNGTSFSAPIIAGMAACLMQAFPLKSNMEIKQAIERSAHLYQWPNDSLGYGIPDFWMAYKILQGNNFEQIGQLNATVFPNPCASYLNVLIKNESACDAKYKILDVSGKCVYKGSTMLQHDDEGILQLNDALLTLSNGNYVLHIEAAGKSSVINFSYLKNP